MKHEMKSLNLHKEAAFFLPLKDYIQPAAGFGGMCVGAFQSCTLYVEHKLQTHSASKEITPQLKKMQQHPHTASKMA